MQQNQDKISVSSGISLGFLYLDVFDLENATQDEKRQYVMECDRIIQEIETKHAEFQAQIGLNDVALSLSSLKKIIVSNSPIHKSSNKGPSSPFAAASQSPNMYDKLQNNLNNPNKSPQQGRNSPLTPGNRNFATDVDVPLKSFKQHDQIMKLSERLHLVCESETTYFFGLIAYASKKYSEALVFFLKSLERDIQTSSCSSDVSDASDSYDIAKITFGECQKLGNVAKSFFQIEDYESSLQFCERTVSVLDAKRGKIEDSMINRFSEMKMKNINLLAAFSTWKLKNLTKTNIFHEKSCQFALRDLFTSASPNSSQEIPKNGDFQSGLTSRIRERTILETTICHYESWIYFLISQKKWDKSLQIMKKLHSIMLFYKFFDKLLKFSSQKWIFSSFFEENDFFLDDSQKVEIEGFLLTIHYSKTFETIFVFLEKCNVPEIDNLNSSSNNLNNTSNNMTSSQLQVQNSVRSLFTNVYSKHFKPYANNFWKKRKVFAKRFKLLKDVNQKFGETGTNSQDADKKEEEIEEFQRKEQLFGDFCQNYDKISQALSSGATGLSFASQIPNLANSMKISDLNDLIEMNSQKIEYLRRIFKTIIEPMEEYLPFNSKISICDPVHFAIPSIPSFCIPFTLAMLPSQITLSNSTNSSNSSIVIDKGSPLSSLFIHRYEITYLSLSSLFSFLFEFAARAIPKKKILSNSENFKSPKKQNSENSNSYASLFRIFHTDAEKLLLSNSDSRSPTKIMVTSFTLDEKQQKNEEPEEEIEEDLDNSIFRKSDMEDSFSSSMFQKSNPNLSPKPKFKSNSPNKRAAILITNQNLSVHDNHYEKSLTQKPSNLDFETEQPQKQQVFYWTKVYLPALLFNEQVLEGFHEFFDRYFLETIPIPMLYLDTPLGLENINPRNDPYFLVGGLVQLTKSLVKREVKLLVTKISRNDANSFLPWICGSFASFELGVMTQITLIAIFVNPGKDSNLKLKIDQFFVENLFEELEKFDKFQPRVFREAFANVFLKVSQNFVKEISENPFLLDNYRIYC